MQLEDLVMNGKYNFKHQPERLEFVGWSGNWAQFQRVEGSGIWAEVLKTDMWMLEESEVVLCWETEMKKKNESIQKTNSINSL
jgi:hypothetical protein